MNMCVHRIFVLAILWVSILAAPVFAAERVNEFTGSRSGHTGVFEVESPWLLDWRVTSEFPEALAIDVSLVEAETGVHAGTVLKSRYVNDGVRLFRQGGKFQFKVDSVMAKWTFRIEQLTEEEAALYTPVR
jgi:hypothetical protein